MSPYAREPIVYLFMNASGLKKYSVRGSSLLKILEVFLPQKRVYIEANV
jgi:hypothetical protein